MLKEFNDSFDRNEEKYQDEVEDEEDTKNVCNDDFSFVGSLTIWINDVQALVSAPVLHTFIASSCHLCVSTTVSLGRTALLPITVPFYISRQIQLATSKFFFLTLDQSRRLILDPSEEASTAEEPTKDDDIFTIICDIALQAKDEITSTLMSMLGFQNTSKASGEHIGERKSSNEVTILDKNKKSRKTRKTTSLFFLRVCDLEMQIPCSYNSNDDAISVCTETSSLPPTSKAIFLKFKLRNPSALDRSLTIKALNSMVNVALGIASDNSTQTLLEMGRDLPSPIWNAQGSTDKLCRKFEGKWHTEKGLQKLEKDILLWSGSMQGMNSKSAYYGKNIPLFKARGIIPNMSPLKLAELLLDSSKVFTYNKHTKGRKDLLVLQGNIHEEQGLFGTGATKIVESQTQIPLSGKKLTMRSLFHVRPLEVPNVSYFGRECSGYIIISRSIVPELDEKVQAFAKSGSKNEVIWGINMLMNVPGQPNKTELINITQANSSLVPSFLTQKVGLTCCNDFYKSLRAIKKQGRKSEKGTQN